MQLSDVAIKKSKSREKSYKLTDGSGLYLLVTIGGGKYWRYDYRFSGKRKTLSLGTYPEVSLKLARERHFDARKQLAEGIDPSEFKKSVKKSKKDSAKNSFEHVAREWLLKFSQNWSSGHLARLTRRFETDIFPYIGSRPISENTINAALRRMGYEKDQMTGHGFRSMASTLLNEQNWAPDAIERQLAHSERNSIRAAYNFAEYLSERKRMMQSWSDYLDTLKNSYN